MSRSRGPGPSRIGSHWTKPESGCSSVLYSLHPQKWQGSMVHVCVCDPARATTALEPLMRRVSWQLVVLQPSAAGQLSWCVALRL